MSDKSGTAHPVATDTFWTTGLTKRELFAAMAMQGLLSVNRRDAFVVVASESVRCADALIAALSKEQTDAKE